MKKAFLLLCLSLFFDSQPLAAEGIDQSFDGKQQAQVSLSEKVLRLFKRPAFDKSYAVVIGINDFNEPDFKDLSTQNDPIKVKDYLINEAGFDEVYLLTNEKVSLERVRSLMEEVLPKKMSDNDRLVFYWSGHGVTREGNRQKLGYLPLSNSSRERYATMLSMKQLAEWDDLLPAKQTLYLLDACFSGVAGVESKSSEQAETLEQIARPSRQILTAGTAEEQTIVIPRLGGSVFTTAILDGLSGEADLPVGALGQDGIVSARELEHYVKRRVAREKTKEGWGKSITPLLTRMTDDAGDFFFFSSQKARFSTETSNSQSQAPNDSFHVQSSSEKYSIFEPVMVKIPAGILTVGCLPSRDLLISKLSECPKDLMPKEFKSRAFQLGKYEVTFDEWDACTRAKVCPNADDEGWGRGKNPVINVSWNDAQVYIRWLNQQTGKNYRLPTEEEWEYAARSGKDVIYPWAEDKASCERARFGFSSHECRIANGSLNVGSYAPNDYGLYDMAGNVSELTRDLKNVSAAIRGSDTEDARWNQLVDHYQRNILSKPSAPLRGGSWTDSSSLLYTFMHDSIPADVGGSYVGFRLLLSNYD